MRKGESVSLIYQTNSPEKDFCLNLQKDSEYSFLFIHDYMHDPTGKTVIDKRSRCKRVSDECFYEERYEYLELNGQNCPDERVKSTFNWKVEPINDKQANKVVGYRVTRSEGSGKSSEQYYYLHE